MKHVLSICVIVVTLLRFSPAFGQNAQDVPTVDENAQLRFQQQKVSANMRELEDRMMRLATLIRDQNPDDSARLLLGVENARDKLIAEQMKEVSSMLSEFQLDEAADEQKIVLEKLTQLRSILLNSKIDAQTSLQQLRSLAEVRSRVANLIIRESKQLQHTTNSNGQSSANMNTLSVRENQNLRLGQQLHQNLIQVAAPEEATIAMQRANRSMSDALVAIKSANLKEAKVAQALAIGQLRNVEQQLVDTKQRMQANAESAARQQVIELLTSAIDFQTGVRNASIAHFKQQQDRLESLNSLAIEQQKIIGFVSECIEITVLAEFSFVLPDALRDIRQQMETVHRMFAQGPNENQIIPIQDQIISDLESLLGAIQQASKSGSPKVKNNKLNCCSDRNEILAELKMLHWMQGQVSRKTKRLRRTLLDGDSDIDRDREAKSILDQQNIIIDVTEKVRTISMNGFTEGESTK